MTDKELQEGIKAFEEALRYGAMASTREDLAGVEENYWIAFNRLKDSPVEEHRNICALCLEAVARILDTEGRPGAADDLRRQAAPLRKSSGQDAPRISKG